MALSLLVGMFLLWITVESASAVTSQEIAALQSFAAAIGSTGWNFNLDPCSGRWPGVLCCLNKDLESDCCKSSAFYPTNPPPCSTTSAVNSTVVAINLDSNYRNGRQLTGFLTDAICNLTSLVILDLNNNFLSGQLPSCIGSRLSRLKLLGISGGNIAGNIPDELGKLSNLEEMYLDSNKFNGSIPASFGGMTSLKKLYLRNNQLAGEIPTQLGRLTNLSELHLQVNSLNGSITPLATLKSLTSLNAFNNHLSGDLSSTFQNLTSLKVLDVHLNDFTGAVPALDERFPNLSMLNLGFNRLSGTIPGSLSRMPSLTNLFLGHNNLSGGIGETSRTLQVLDVSHNSLTGALRNLSQQLQVDFSFNSLETTTAPPSRVQNGKQYFNCIPNGTSSCSQTGDAFSFAITAGGTQDLNNKDGTRFRKDVAANTTGLYYFPDPDSNWALELSGTSAGVLPTSVDVTAVPAQDDPSLYQSMRWSSSYMAYHGSGLENGTYEVTLYFCESVFRNASYRAFDVIVQGEVLAKRLDVAKEVGLLTAYKISRNATVARDGRLSIEFINTGPDRYLDPKLYKVTSSGAMVSAISVKSLSHISSGSSTATWKIAVPTSVAIAFLAITILLVGFWCKRNKSRDDGSNAARWPSDQPVGLTTYTYKELYNATNGFDPKLKLGQGGFGSVYMGHVQGQILVAIKQLLHQNQQSREAFKKEIEILSSIQHRNLVAVRGYCLDAEHPMLVCDYMQNGSLDQFLHGSNGFLTWPQRRKIAIDTAFGLAYLHDESKHRIIHCDLKPPNILLDDDFTPRIADFGMARLYEEGRSHVTATRMGGTIGYLAPEYAMHYQLSDKADVYSFGVVLLEMISGRRAVDSSRSFEQVVLVEYAYSLASVSTEELLKLLDSGLEGKCDMKEVLDMARVAVLCTLETPALRPKMRAAWLMLKGTLDILDIPLTQDSKLSTVRALMSAYEVYSAASSQERLIALSPRTIQGWCPRRTVRL